MREDDPQKNKLKSFGSGGRVWLWLYVIGFVLALLLPILTINRVGGQVSPTENRYLASFPQLLDEEGHLADGLKSGFTSWLSDNIGLRTQFVKIAANIKFNIFGQPLTDQVEMGRDGWYFYTPNHNIELATGRYTLSEEVLAQIAEKQQRVSDWYESQGITYVLVLTAAKTSIYPEYIASGDYGVQTTPCDQLEEYLNEHTTVQVVNTKYALLNNKDQGKLYLKTDSHWTHLGSYTAYQAIAEKLNDLGITTRDFDVSFGEQAVTGEFSGMMGVADILGQEIMPYALWEASVDRIESGSEYDALSALSGDFLPVILENSSWQDGTCLIYGDSQWMTNRNLPQWLGESFQKVVSLRTNDHMGSIDWRIDSLVQPEVVIFGCSERYIDSVLLRPVGIPQVIDALPAMQQKKMVSEQEYGQWIGNEGICLDDCNGEHVEGSGPIYIHSDAETVTINGWAADFGADAPFEALYLKVGDAVFKCGYGIDRTSVVNHFGKETLLNTGFEATFPRSCLRDEAVTEISFIGVSANRQYLYEPVTYQVTYS